MMTINIKFKAAIFSLLISSLLVLAGCASKAEPESTGPALGSRVHWDANLEFSIEYPSNWIKDRIIRQVNRPEGIRWHTPDHDNDLPHAKFIITTVPPEQAIGGYERLVKDFSIAQPNFTITASEEIALPAISSYRLSGFTSDYSAQVYFITASQRAYLLDFRALPQHFEAYQPVFDEIVRSFLVTPPPNESNRSH